MTSPITATSTLPAASASSQLSVRAACVSSHRSPPRRPTSAARASLSSVRNWAMSSVRADRTTGSTTALRGSVEDRAVVVLDRAPRRVGAHEEEAARAQRLVGAFGLQPVERLATVVDRSFLVLVVLLVLGGDHPILEDPVEIGFDIVRRKQVVVVVLLLFLRLPLANPRGALGVILGLVLGNLLLELVLFDGKIIAFELLLVRFADEDVLLEFGL